MAADPTAPGRTRWVIPEGYIPGWSTGPEPQFLSHETACILDAGDAEAHVEITDYASVIVSDVPVVVQHTRLDSRQAENALLSTIAWPVD